MKVYIGNYMTDEEIAAEIDDPSVHDMDLGDFASPQFSNVGLELDEVVLATKSQAFSQVVEEYEGPLPPTEWSLDVIRSDANPSNGRRPHWTWVLGDSDGHPYAVVVVQEVEAD